MSFSILNTGLTELEIRGWDAHSGISVAELDAVKALIERTVPVLCNHPDFYRDPCFVDHACSNRACCNLRHLRLLPLAINRELGNHKKLYSR